MRSGERHALEAAGTLHVLQKPLAGRGGFNAFVGRRLFARLQAGWFFMKAFAARTKGGRKKDEERYGLAG